MDIKHYLEKESVGITRPKLHDYDPHIPPAAWLLLRWCVLSNLASLYQLHLLMCFQCYVAGVSHHVPQTSKS